MCVGAWLGSGTAGGSLGIRTACSGAARLCGVGFGGAERSAAWGLGAVEAGGGAVPARCGLKSRNLHACTSLEESLRRCAVF